MMVNKIFAVMMASFISLFWAEFSFSGEVDLPQTGQTTCYDESGNIIPCPGTGQDGDIQAGVAWPYPRFTDNGNGTVTDKLTGLIWLKNANCAGKMTWPNALTFCNNLSSGQCGLTDDSSPGDWRLPNIIELESLVNAEVPNPATWLNTQGFTNVQSSIYWSATTYAGNSSVAWLVSMRYGSVGAYYKTYDFFYYVWPVRAGQ